MSTTTLHAVSLFAGIGGIDLGLAAAGIPTRLFCEADKACRDVLDRRFPGVPIHPDVRTLTADDLHNAGCDPARTVLTGGFPCQDLSVAGRRAGMGQGTRSGLYWQIDRLLAEFAPAWVILENVPGLLSSNDGRDMGAVVGSLADRGYGFAWRVLDAQHFGVAQRRARVVIVGRFGDSGAAPVQVLLEPESSGRDSSAGDEAWPDTAVTFTGGSSSPGVSAPGRRNEDDVNLVLTGTGIARAVTTSGGRRWDDTQETYIVSALQAHCGKLDAEGAADGHLIPVTYQRVVRSGARDADGNLPPDVWEQRDVAATLSASDLEGCSAARAVELVVTHTLRAEGHDAGEDGTGRGTPLVVTNGVRRLTPLECERLQGLPDGWTEGQSDSRRYHQIGNSVAVPVFEWVGRRLVSAA